MASFEIRHSWGASLGFAMLAALPGFASSQPASAAEDQRAIILERINEARSKGGPYAKELIDPLTSLAEIYQESGNPDLAAAATEQAMQVIRANYGLRSLDQAPLIQQRIRTEEERGNAAVAWDLEQALLTLARANQSDLRSAAIFGEIADKRVDMLRRYSAGEIPPQLQLGCYYRDFRFAGNDQTRGRSCASGSRRVAIRSMLTDAHANYLAAVGILRAAGQYSAELRDLELDVVRSTYTYGGTWGTGRNSLRRLANDAVANAEPLARRAEAFMHIVDWDLLYEQRPAAVDAYEAAYDFLKRDGADPALIDALFSPEIPVMLPAFEPNPLVTQPSDEHIDVSFVVTRYGDSERVRVLERTANVPGEVEERLVRVISAHHFRPRVVDGEFPRSAPVVVRYYLGD